MRLIKRVRVVLTALCTAFTVVACEGGLKSLSNQELAAKHEECVMGNPTAPGKVTACENIRKECQRRRKEGNYTC